MSIIKISETISMHINLYCVLIFLIDLTEKLSHTAGVNTLRV